MSNIEQQQQQDTSSSSFFIASQHNNQFYLDTNFIQFNQFKMTVPKTFKSMTANPYLMKRVEYKQQQQQQQPKNYIQKLYEIKTLQPIQFDLVSSTGPAHKPNFEMKLTINSKLKNEKTFISSGVSKKQAKLNSSKDALRYLTDLEDSERIRYLNEMEIIEIKNLFLQECTDSSLTTTIKTEEEQQIFSNDALNLNTNFFTNFLQTSTTTASPTKLLNSTNPISMFTELVPNEAYSMKFVDEWGDSHAKQFKIQLIVKLKSIKMPIDGGEEEKTFYAIGNSKKQAKSRVTQTALEELFKIKIDLKNSNSNNTIVDDVKFKRFANSISDLIKEKYVEQMLKISSNAASQQQTDSNDSKLRTVYAAIIQTNDPDLSLNESKIVCITSGTKCINGEFMSLTGDALNDCHAEILACRLLKKYLYEQLEVYIDYLLKKFTQKQTVEDLMMNENYIYELLNSEDDEDEDASKRNHEESNKCFRLKENIKFHLFISTTPCGDGRIFAPHENHDGIDNHPNRKIRGLLRAKLESGEGTIPVGLNSKLQTWDSILHGDRLKVMSCSDKLCKLNVVGVQGALLSHFIEAIYFDSFIIGSYYHYDHLSRALYGRIEESINNLPIKFKLNKPILSTIVNTDARQLTKSSNKAYIWSDVLKTKHEIINTKDGKPIDSKTPSNCCKNELFKSWMSIHKKLIENKSYFKLNDYLNSLNDFNYSTIKQRSINYQKAKISVLEAFKQASLGHWIQKPFEQDFFDF